MNAFYFSESKVSSGHVSKRIDDVHGLGWGNVKTGFVSKKKLGFLQREMSVERDSNSSSPVPNGKGRGLRVTFADSALGWSDGRAQTPPLAAEWSQQNKSQATLMSQSHMSSSSFQSSQSSQSSSFSSKVQKSSFSSSSQSSSIQASKAFEAFPGLGGIESLKIE